MTNLRTFLASLLRAIGLRGAAKRVAPMRDGGGGEER